MFDFMKKKLRPELSLENKHRRRQKLIVLAGMAAVGVVVLLAYQLYLSHREQIATAKVTTHNYATIFEARLDSTLRRVDADLLERARTIPLEAFARSAVGKYSKEINAKLDGHLVHFVEIAGFRVYDVDGNLLYSSSWSSTQSVNVADRAYFRQLRENPASGPVFSEVIVSRITGRKTIVVARAIVDKHGKFHGVVSAALDFEHFQRLFESLNLGRLGVIVIRRSDDMRLVAGFPQMDQLINQPLPADNPVSVAIAAGKFELTSEVSASYDNVIRILSFRRLDSYPFLVAAGLANRDVLAGWRARSAWIGAIGIGLLWALVSLLRRLWRSEARALKAVQEMERRESMFRTLTESAPVGIYRTDAAGRCTYVNERCCEISGLSRAAALGDGWVQSLPPDEREPMLLKQSLGLKNRKPYLEQLRLVHPDGKTVWAICRGQVETDMHGRFQGHVGMLVDITAQKNVELKLLEAQKMLHHLGRYQSQQVEAERKRIAQELHDEMGQLLTCINLAASTLKLSNPDSQEIIEFEDKVQQLLQRAHQFIRNITTTLRPVILDQGLSEALRWLASEIEQQSGLSCEVELTGDAGLLDDAIVMPVFRIAQELLTNVMRHAQATAVCLRADFDELICLSVSDNGCGFDVESIMGGKGFGLLGIRERVSQLDGVMEISSGKDVAGTTIVISIPRKLASVVDDGRGQWLRRWDDPQ